MQLESGQIQRFRGLSTESKPGTRAEEIGQPLQLPPVGSTFTEIDTGARFVWRADGWIRQEQTIESLLERLIIVNEQVLETLAATQRGHAEYLWENEAPE